MKLTICNETFHVEVQYAKRKKIKLEATPEGHLTLKVPRHTSEEDIVAFLESKSEFLMNLRQKQKNKNKSLDKLEMTAEKREHCQKMLLKYHRN